MCILLVEDEVIIRMCLAEVMTDAGFHVVDVADAESALSVPGMIRAPRIIVTDVNLGPGMSGLALAAAARNRWPGIPILLMSGVKANFASIYSGTAERFMLKPFSLAAFLKTITDMVGDPTISSAGLQSRADGS